jgi:hypothetical protein
MPKGLRRFHSTGQRHFITCSCYRRQPFLGSINRGQEHVKKSKFLDKGVFSIDRKSIGTPEQWLIGHLNNRFLTPNYPESQESIFSHVPDGTFSDIF